MSKRKQRSERRQVLNSLNKRKRLYRKLYKQKLTKGFFFAVLKTAVPKRSDCR